MYDVIVVGGGAMGSAASYYLSKNKLKVLMIDQYSIPNLFGSHHGHTRMFRLANGNGGRYVPLGLESLKLWKELEKETGKTLFNQTGALTVGHPQSDFVKEAIASAEKYKLPYEIMSSDQMMGRWPGIQIPENYYGCFDPDAGFLFSEESILTFKEEAMAQDVDILEHEPVMDLDFLDGSVQVMTAHHMFTARKIVVTAGAWISKLLESLELPIQPIRKTIGWFQPNDERLYSSDYPCFVFDTEADGHYYGFPDFDGSGVKLGRMDLGYETDADSVNREFGSYEDDEGDIRRFLEKYMPKAAGPLVDGKVSMFANTPDHDFIVDIHPDRSNVLLAGGFSGHGFKFASVIGSILADLTLDGTTNRDISFLSLQRFAKKALY